MVAKIKLRRRGPLVRSLWFQQRPEKLMLDLRMVHSVSRVVFAGDIEGPREQPIVDEQKT